VRPDPDNLLRQAYRRHDRHWRDNAYCYPVVSRRSAGLSVGINLNPDKACNFDCIYCQVDRTTPPRSDAGRPQPGQPPSTTRVDLAVLRAELDDLLDRAVVGTLFEEPPFDVLPADRRAVRDIAFSGDGEPTASPRFEEAVRIAADARNAHGLGETKLVLITDACYLTRPKVRSALSVLDANNGEIWAKLDAGTEAYFRRVNRPSHSLSHVLANILDAGRVRPIVIQSLWMRIDDEPPPDAEVQAYCDRIAELMSAGGQIKLIQVYTIARQAAERSATALSTAELDAVADAIGDQVEAQVDRFGGISD
jgi:wyosine [tRNA(Phe)-imidazoG37] synthetase (radical SAM superfamily)